jgi:hypothetical protein
MRGLTYLAAAVAITRLLTGPAATVPPRQTGDSGRLSCRSRHSRLGVKTAIRRRGPKSWD